MAQMLAAKTTDTFTTVARAMAGEAKKSLGRQRLADLERPVGSEALRLGITDYRRKPDPDISAHDWAVWRVRWDGTDWVRKQRLTAKQSLDEALTSIGRLCTQYSLSRV